MKRSEKKDFVTNLKEDFSSATSVIVAEYSGLTVNDTKGFVFNFLKWDWGLSNKDFSVNYVVSSIKN